jgi:hypothetical protein
MYTLHTNYDNRLSVNMRQLITNKYLQILAAIDKDLRKS